MPVFADSATHLVEEIHHPCEIVSRTEHSALLAVRVDPGMRVPLRPDLLDRVVFVVSGHARISVDDAPHEVEASEVLVVPVGAAATVESADGNVVGLVVVLAGRVAAELPDPHEVSPPAAPGDRLVIPSRTLGGPARDGEIVAVSRGGGPPYTVRWSNSGRLSVYFPSGEVEIHHRTAPAEATGPKTVPVMTD